MAELTYDPKKVKLVSIDELTPNDWNPKEPDTLEYKRVKKSIETIGLEGAIITRQYKGKNQVVDGMQRYTAAKELGFKEVYIYDEGKLSDQKARERTIWWQQQVPFNKVDEAYLVNQITEMGETIELPYTEVELEELKTLAIFDFDQYTADREEADEDDGNKTLKIVLPQNHYDLAMSLIERIKDQNDCNDAQAFMTIVEYYERAGA